MRRIILTAIALVLCGGVASADRWRGHRDTSHRSGGTVVRDHRHREPVRVERRGNFYRDRDYRRHRVERRPVYVNNGRYVFHGGVSRAYHRPVIRHRYYDYRYRPQIIVENYDPVPGYLWVQGSWNWNGYEWVWTSGYWMPDSNYDNSYYDNSYDNYDNSGYYPAQTHTHYDGCGHGGVSGGIHVEGNIRF